MEFKDILRELREEKGLTQTELAKEMNFSRSTITKWENGRKEPGLQNIRIIAKYFNVSADYLIGLED